MILTLTNNTTKTFNKVQVHDGGSLATGGQRENPLPYPFNWVAPLVPLGTAAFPIHEADFRHKDVPWQTFEARDMWNTVLAANSIPTANLAAVLTAESMTVPATGLFETEELLISSI